MTLKDLEAAALKLPLARRAKLAASLLSSLSDEEPAEIENAWVEEADRRYRACRHGSLRAIPAADALYKARESQR
jgi:hypothetical protein